MTEHIDEEPGRWGPEDVYPGLMGKLPPGAIITNVVVLMEYIVPGADDVDERGPWLSEGRNTKSGSAIWRHTGMLMTYLDELRQSVHTKDDD